jgi:hypothetical protein
MIITNIIVLLGDKKMEWKGQQFSIDTQKGLCKLD